MKRSQSPQIGASLRTHVECSRKSTCNSSQSPQIGASLRTTSLVTSGHQTMCLNPLKSGQAFGHSRNGRNIYTMDVSIPSNRGKPSDLLP